MIKPALFGPFPETLCVATVMRISLADSVFGRFNEIIRGADDALLQLVAMSIHNKQQRT